ncbi:MAG: hypothetical protein C0603_03550 [Denitrovibrio sp.]|nr:MAG: hypothetical protein C0603_03550 [Denitrovibrio sp.]
MVYKVDKKLVILTTILLVSSIFFTFSVHLAGFGKPGIMLCSGVVLFILFNLVVLLSKKIEINDGVICQTTIYGKKDVKISEIGDIGVVKLRWRIILILSDPHKFVFISSMYEDFEDFVQYLKDNVTGYVESLLAPVTAKNIRKKRKFLLMLILSATAFFTVSGVYNILYR